MIIYWSKVYISTINTHDRDLGVEVTDLEFQNLKFSFQFLRHYFLTYHRFDSSLVWWKFCIVQSSTISPLPSSGRQHKMTHKGWLVKPQHNQILDKKNQQTSF